MDEAAVAILERPQMLYGRRFLEALKDHFNSGYLTASDILNGESKPTE